MMAMAVLCPDFLSLSKDLAKVSLVIIVVVTRVLVVSKEEIVTTLVAIETN